MALGLAGLGTKGMGNERDLVHICTNIIAFAGGLAFWPSCSVHTCNLWRAIIEKDTSSAAGMKSGEQYCLCKTVSYNAKDKAPYLTDSDSSYVQPPPRR